MFIFEIYAMNTIISTVRGNDQTLPDENDSSQYQNNDNCTSHNNNNINDYHWEGVIFTVDLCKMYTINVLKSSTIGEISNALKLTFTAAAIRHQGVAIFTGTFKCSFSVGAAVLTNVC